MRQVDLDLVESLDELAVVLRGDEGGRLDWMDWTSLPVFGGKEPADTLGVWSWDEGRLLVGGCRSDLEIVAREQWGEASKYRYVDPRLATKRRPRFTWGEDEAGSLADMQAMVGGYIEEELANRNPGPVLDREGNEWLIEVNVTLRQRQP